ncbi:hypothetical protein EYR40_004670 [Pleurotus pulmonarius]|nr:hypothetical protein EYR40_004670 [Pleurotus pulmonarius]
MSENPVSQTSSQQASPTSGGTNSERPQTPPRRPQANDPKPTPRVARLAALHLWSMYHVQLDKLFLNIAHETRGHYIGDVDPIEFIHTFLPWNLKAKLSKPFQAFMAQKPSDAQIAALVSMPTCSTESEMNRACYAALVGWPNANNVLCRSIDFEDTHNFRDSFSGLGPDGGLYNRKKPWIRRKRPLNTDFANMISFVELKLREYLDAFVDTSREPYVGPGPDDSNWEKAGVLYMDGEGDAGPEAADDEAEEEADIPAEEAFVAEDDHGTYTENSPEDTVEVDDASDPSPSARYRFENDTEGGRKTRGQIASYAGVMMAMQFRSHLFSVLICGKYARFIRWDRSCAIVSRRFDYTLYPRILFNFYHRFAQLTDTQRGLLPCFKMASDKQASAALQALKAYAGDAYGPVGGEQYKQRLDKRCVPLLHMKYNNDQFIVPAPTFNGGMFSPFGRMTRNRPAVLITKNVANCVVMFFKDYWREHSEHTKTEAEVYNLLATNAKTKECLYFAKMHAGGDAEVAGRPATTIGYDMSWNTEGATHGLVDDRESALHVLLYMSIRHLAHNKANGFAMQDLLHMFDDYIEVEGSPYRQGTMSKLNFMTSGFKRLIFDISPVNMLVRNLCESFSARYEEETEDAEEDEDADDQDVKIAALQAVQRQTRLDNMKKPEWLYDLFRRYARRLSIPSPGGSDYIDNTKLIKPNRKRALADDLCDEADGSKLISTHDSMAGSIDADMDLAPPVETPPHKKQRSSRK